ncbi:hypothetical protein GGF46_000466 [Coemansia sp. RSA 552]|nr:hypothetical protein GGF46_000466 [Coemansia sp. RSA 552]
MGELKSGAYDRSDGHRPRGHTTIEMGQMGGDRPHGSRDDGGRRPRGPSSRPQGGRHRSGSGIEAEFYAKLDSLKKETGDVEQQISRVKEAHSAASNMTRRSDIGSSMKSLVREDEINQAKSMIVDLKLGVHKLRDLKRRCLSSRSLEKSTKHRIAIMYSSQADKAKRVTERFRDTMAGFSTECRNQLIEQYMLANPDATRREAEDAAYDDTADQAFAMAVKRSNRNDKAARVLSNVRERRNDVKKIEEAVRELADMIAELADLVESQQETLDSIEEATEEAHRNVEQGRDEVVKAVELKKKSNKCKWIFLVVLIVLAIVVAVVLYLKLKK